MCGRAEAARGKRRRADALKPPVERQVKVVPALFSVRDHVESRIDLVVHGCDHGVSPHLFDISLAKLLQMSRCKLKPSRKRVAANHSRLQRASFLAWSEIG